MYADFNNMCAGKANCKFVYKKYLKFKQEHIDECQNEKTQIYFQFGCDMEDTLITNKRIGALVACLGMISCISLSFTVYRLKNMGKLNYKHWDLNTCTAADFTVFVRFKKKLWNKWLENKQEILKDTTCFKGFLKAQMIKQLEPQPISKGFENET